MEDKPVENEEGKDKIVKAKKKKAKRNKGLNHPPTTEMILEAIENLGEKKGSSVQAIRAYLINMYDVKPEMMKSMMKRALTSSLKEGQLERPPDQINNTVVLSGRYKLTTKAMKKEPVAQSERQKKLSMAAQKLKPKPKKKKKRRC